MNASEYTDSDSITSPALVQKLKVWRNRYLPAELYSLIVTMVAAVLTYEATHSHLITAIVGTVAGSCVYFGYILAMDIRFARRKRHAHGKPYCLQTFIQNIKALVVEFGVAEVIDLFIIRPALMYYLPLWIENLAFGTLVAKLLADMTFYIPAIMSYELSKRWLREFS